MTLLACTVRSCHTTQQDHSNCPRSHNKIPPCSKLTSSGIVTTVRTLQMSRGGRKAHQPDLHNGSCRTCHAYAQRMFLVSPRKLLEWLERNTGSYLSSYTVIHFELGDKAWCSCMVMLAQATNGAAPRKRGWFGQRKNNNAASTGMREPISPRTPAATAGTPGTGATTDTPATGMNNTTGAFPLPVSTTERSRRPGAGPACIPRFPVAASHCMIADSMHYS